MKEKIFIEQHVEKTCDLIIQHIKNIITFQENINKPLGGHSRFMERLLHPEEVLVFRGTSKLLYENKDLARRKEHIVPMSYLLDQLWYLILDNKYSDKELSSILKRNLGVAHITYEESLRLDTKKSGLKMKMPDNWRLGIDDPLDRLKAVDIILLDEKKK